jgi:23S rRNA pseudouridine1911/1915/1917 synthase
VIEFLGKKYSLIEVDLKTGRTHQIRVHFKYLGWPLVGDKIYSGDMNLGLDRPFLHCCQLSFVDEKNEQMSFKSELTDDLKNLLLKMGYESQG